MSDTPTALSPDQIDKPACFYLGREYDLDARRVLPDRPIMYEARYLTIPGASFDVAGTSGALGAVFHNIPMPFDSATAVA